MRTGHKPASLRRDRSGLWVARKSSSSPYANAVLATAGLVSYWRLDESSGTSAADSKGANTGTYTGGFTLAQAGGTTDGDTAVALNGSTGYVNVPHNANLAIVGDLTLEALVKPTDFANFNVIVGKDLGSLNKPYEWRLEQTTGKPNLIVDNAATSFFATAAPPTGAYSHLAVTISGTTWTHYLNGAANGTGTLATRAADGATALKIGSRDDLVAAIFFKGSLDEVAVYNVALSGATIAAHNAAR